MPSEKERNGNHTPAVQGWLWDSADLLEYTITELQKKSC